MVRAHAGSDQKLEILGLGEALLGDVGRVERRGDENVCIREFLV